MARTTPAKDALEKLLRQQFGQVEREKTFDWLNWPPRSKNLEDYELDYRKIVKALIVHSKSNMFCLGRPAYQKMACDFVVPKRKLIIEIDEKQHFTAARKVALRHYPNEIKPSFKREWIILCNWYDAHDKDKKNPHRDERRALYDSIRDIAAFRNGWKLIRIHWEHIEWLTEIP